MRAPCAPDRFGAMLLRVGLNKTLDVMRKVIFALVAVILSSSALHAAGGRVISLESLEEMFAGIKADTKWSTDGELLWGYFFTDHNPKKFAPLIKHLESVGYKYVGLLEPEKKGGVYFLHVERVEHHTPQSLHARNQELYALAERYGVETYDGMDGGEVGK